MRRKPIDDSDAHRSSTRAMNVGIRMWTSPVNPMCG